MADDNYDEDIFADLYDDDGEPAAAAPEPAPAPAPAPEPVKSEPAVKEEHRDAANGASSEDTMQDTQMNDTNNDMNMHSGYGDVNGGMNQDHGGMQGGQEDSYEHEPIGMKEDGKMFIGGLNWETTDQSLKDYFTQFGEVLECTVMRDGATGRSRGFGFLTFKDPKTVNIVMVKEHHLDGKIIDPKRAIPREEQERTAKIFVGGVSQECTEQYFKEFFMKFGRVIDATLMMDKDTGRPRGFGFVTFDGEDAVDRTLAQPLNIHGKPIEVKRAEPRGNMHEEKAGAGGGNGANKFNKRDRFTAGREQSGSFDGGEQSQFQQGGQNAQSTAGMSQAQMAQYWFKMQEYFRGMQQVMAAQSVQAQAGMGMMPQGMNPAMMQQMMMNQPRMMSPDGTAMGQNGAMSPAMMQQMQNQMMQQQQQQQPSFGVPPAAPAGPQAAMMGRSPSGGASRPGFNAQEQMMFEQQKYERQQAARMQQSQYAAQQGMGGPTSWEGMYDDVPAPHMAPTGPAGGRGGNFGGRGGHQNRGGIKHQHNTPPAGPVNAPPNAPTGPKNAGRPGGNYRGGGRGGRARGWHPY